MNDAIIIVGIFGSLYTVSVGRELLRQRRQCPTGLKCRASLIAAAGAAVGEACYAFSGETILYFLTR